MISFSADVTQTILENLPDESEFWARGDHVAIVADQELKIFDTVNSEWNFNLVQGL